MFEPTRTIDRLPSGKARRMRKIRLAAVEGLSRPGRSFAGAEAVFRTSQSSASGYPLTILNWLYLAGLYRQAARHPGVTLFDQGVLQAVWSVAYGSKSLENQASQSWVDRAGEFLNPGSVAVFIDVDDAELRSRLANRRDGMSRLDAAMGRSGEAAEEALLRGRAALDIVDVIAGRLKKEGLLRVIRTDSGSSDPESLASELVACLMSGK